MSKTLCELKKSLKRDLQSYAQLVRNATHVCSKCGRAANNKKLLCKPVKMDNAELARTAAAGRAIARVD
jgi:hypothetical protein